jgi:hypothetical protein
VQGERQRLVEALRAAEEEREEERAEKQVH